MVSRTPRTWKQLLKDRKVLSWVFYDWANSAFATTVLAGFFPVFFKKYWSAGVDVNTSTYHLGAANSLAALVIASLSPILGAIADQGSAKKRALIVFTSLGIVMTGALSLVKDGDWQLATIIYVLASIGFAGSNSFYDSLIVFTAPAQDTNRVSAMGYSFGYLGGGVLFTLNVLMTLKPELFGLPDATQAVKVSFLSVSVWWAVFTLPLLLFVEEEKRPSLSYFAMAKAGIWQLIETFDEIRMLKNLGLFLLAYFFYIDGVNTIIAMAVDYGMALGFESNSLIVALLITQFVGFPATLLFGQIAHKIGSRKGLYLGISVYVLVCIFGSMMNSVSHFYILAMVIGLVQGGIQALSRSVFAHMIPAEKSGEYFGFFNMLGKFSSMLGPYLVGLVSVATQNSRLSLLSIVILFLIGGTLLAFVQMPSEKHLNSEKL